MNHLTLAKIFQTAGKGEIFVLSPDRGPTSATFQNEPGDLGDLEGDLGRFANPGHPIESCRPIWVSNPFRMDNLQGKIAVKLINWVTWVILT